MQFRVATDIIRVCGESCRDRQARFIFPDQGFSRLGALAPCDPNYLLSNDHSVSFCDGTFRFLSTRRLIAGIALALAVVAVPSRSSAQISLGTGQYGVFEESGGTFVLSGASAITGNVELGLNAKLNKDQSSSISGSTTPNVSAVSTTLPGPNSVTPYANGFSVTSANTVTLNGSAGVNVYNITGSMSLSGGGTLKIIGAANETFVFNVSNGVSFTGASKMVLSGVDASQIIFNVTGNTSIDGASKALGTFVDQNGTITVNGASTVTVHPCIERHHYG